MKKCKGCNQEIDKYAIACEYCGKLAVSSDPQNSPEAGKTKKKPEEKQKG